MTIQELQNKLNDANERVEKRLNTIKKLCIKLNVNYQELVDKYHNYKPKYSDYLLTKESKTIVDSFIQEKNTRDENGNWNYESYEFNSKISQLIDNLPKLYDLEKVVNNWMIKLHKEQNKQAIEKILAIWNFLTEWENKSIEWYKQNAELYFNLKKEYHNKKEEYKNSEEFEEVIERTLSHYSKEYLEKHPYARKRVEEHLIEEYSQRYFSNIDSFTKLITHIKTTYNYDTQKYNWISYTIDEELLNKEIAKEKEDKYFDLVKRVTALVGEITDASNLSIGNQRGELNGIIIGTNGKVRVETISAGGYNIQRFHYRVLLKEIK